MKRTLKLEFVFDDNLKPPYSCAGIGLKVRWVERDVARLIPVEFWPRTPEELEREANVLLPGFESAKKLAIIKHRVRLATVEHFKDKQIRRVRVKSRSSGKAYIITVHPDGEKTCNCPDFMFRRRKSGTHCKHISAWLDTQDGEEQLEREKKNRWTLGQIKYAMKHADYLKFMFIRDELVRKTRESAMAHRPSPR